MSSRSYRRLEPDEIISTIGNLERRITEDMGERGLTDIARELGRVAGDAKRRVVRLQRKNWWLYVLPLAASLLIVYLSVSLIGNVDQALENLVGGELRADLRQIGNDLKQIFDHVKLPIVLAVPVPLVIGVFISMWTLDSRWKRRKSLGYLHELRSIIHVIDMHQLSKLPHGLPIGGDGELAGEKLRRYMSYCADLLSMAGKIAALYAESAQDPIVIETVNALGQSTSNLSNKIWQRIEAVKAPPAGLFSGLGKETRVGTPSTL